MTSTLSRRWLLTLGAALLAGCASSPQYDSPPPIVFIHGNGDSAATWQSTIWRFESNNWPRERLFALDHPYPLARDDDAKPQPGRSSTAEHMAYVKAEVEKVLRATGADRVVLVGNSRGGNVIRNYIQNGGGDRTVSHAILGGTPNHGVWAVPGRNEGSEFAGTGPFLTALNAPKNAAGDEVAGPVKWLTVRSDNNDKFAQPHGRWIGAPDLQTNVTFAGPELKGATNVVIPRIDHRETSYSPQAFDAAFRFLKGRAPETLAVTQEDAVILSGKINGLGVDPQDPKTGNFPSNLPLAGAQLEIHAVDTATGQRLPRSARFAASGAAGVADFTQTVGADGRWGPFAARPGLAYEFVVSAPGYATSHIYRSAFPRSSNIVHLRAERIAEADKAAAAIVTMTRPRGYFDPERDKMSFDGQSPPPGALPGAGVASSKIKPNGAESRPVVAEFNGERVVGRTWPAAQGHVTTLELTN